MKKEITIKSSLAGTFWLTLNENETAEISKHEDMEARVDAYYEILNKKIDALNKLLEKEMPEIGLDLVPYDSYSYDDEDLIDETSRN
jgi:hypothetical protein